MIFTNTSSKSQPLGEAAQVRYPLLSDQTARGEQRRPTPGRHAVLAARLTIGARACEMDQTTI